MRAVDASRNRSVAIATAARRDRRARHGRPFRQRGATASRHRRRLANRVAELGPARSCGARRRGGGAQLTEHFGLTDDWRVEAGGDPEQVPQRAVTVEGESVRVDVLGA